MSDITMSEQLFDKIVAERDALYQSHGDLLNALRAMRKAIQGVKEMNHHRFDALGLQVNSAIAKAERLLRHD